MSQRIIRVGLSLAMDDDDERSIRSTAEEDFGVDGAADIALADVLVAIVRNTLEAQLIGFGVPVEVTEVAAIESAG